MHVEGAQKAGGVWGPAPGRSGRRGTHLLGRVYRERKRALGREGVQQVLMVLEREGPCICMKDLQNRYL